MGLFKKNTKNELDEFKASIGFVDCEKLSKKQQKSMDEEFKKRKEQNEALTEYLQQLFNTYNNIDFLDFQDEVRKIIELSTANTTLQDGYLSEVNGLIIAYSNALKSLLAQDDKLGALQMMYEIEFLLYQCSIPVYPLDKIGYIESKLNRIQIETNLVLSSLKIDKELTKTDNQNKELAFVEINELKAILQALDNREKQIDSVINQLEINSFTEYSDDLFLVIKQSERTIRDFDSLSLKNKIELSSKDELRNKTEHEEYKNYIITLLMEFSNDSSISNTPLYMNILKEFIDKITNDVPSTNERAVWGIDILLRQSIDYLNAYHMIGSSIVGVLSSIDKMIRSRSNTIGEHYENPQYILILMEIMEKKYYLEFVNLRIEKITKLIHSISSNKVAFPSNQKSLIARRTKNLIETKNLLDSQKDTITEILQLYEKIISIIESNEGNLGCSLEDAYKMAVKIEKVNKYKN